MSDKMKLTLSIERDNGDILVKIDSLNVYGVGETLEKAMSMLARDMTVLRDDLNEEDRFSKDWHIIKSILNWK